MRVDLPRTWSVLFSSRVFPGHIRFLRRSLLDDGRINAVLRLPPFGSLGHRPKQEIGLWVRQRVHRHCEQERVCWQKRPRLMNWLLCNIIFYLLIWNHLLTWDMFRDIYICINKLFIDPNRPTFFSRCLSNTLFWRAVKENKREATFSKAGSERLATLI